ncbi:unannotated protein [freshwater metagenome]|uniref:Unannotated protein n=1 Tax=freshwater metagenome TaxID=449393 RepID=A0A6J6RK63_9ZZZZ
MLQFACLRNNARVSRKDTRDIGVNLTTISTKRCRQSNCRGVRSTTTKGGDFFVGTDALEASDDTDLALGQCLTHTIALHFKNLGFGVHGVGNDADLAARETDGVNTHAGKSHTYQSHRDALTSGEQHVEFAIWLDR